MNKKTKRIAVYPGSFDPITYGHIDIIHRVAKLYDELVILIAISPTKAGLFSFEERKDLIEKSLPDVKNISIDQFEGLTTDYLKKIGSKVIVRGLRAVVDFEYEMSMANINKKLAPDVETVLVFASPECYFISSRGVKEVAKFGGQLDDLVPRVVSQSLSKKIRDLKKRGK